MLKSLSSTVLRSSRSKVNVGLKRSASGYAAWPMFSEEHLMLSDMCRSFADEQLAPNASAYDKAHKFPEEKITAMGDLGLMGLIVPEE